MASHDDSGVDIEKDAPGGASFFFIPLYIYGQH
jgi:hypothetical protein